MLNIALAFTLFLFTLGFIYTFWYMIRGKRDVRGTGGRTDPHGTEKTAVEEAGKDEKKRKEGYRRSDYCYPKINDIMGYDFVKVVEVPENLRPKKDQTEPKEEKKDRPRWDDASSTGMRHVEDEGTDNAPQAVIQAVPAEARQEDIQNLDDQETAKRYDDYVATHGGNAAAENDEEEEMNDISEEDYAALQNGAAVLDWPMNENDDPAMYDDYIEENPGIIDAGDSDEEARKVAAEMKKIGKMVETLTLSATSQARDLLDEIDFPEDNENQS